MDTIDIRIPCVPPSVNHYLGNRVCGKRVIRYITAKGNAFKKIVQKCVKPNTLMIPKDHKLRVDVELEFKDRRRRDVDNYNKVLLDSLSGLVWEDDTQIYYITVHKKSGCSLDMTRVIINEYNEP